MWSYAKQGNLWHILTLCLSFSFAVSVVLFADSTGAVDDVVFDEEWKKNGFCISNPDSPFWTSHDLAFYIDVAFSTLFLGLWFAWRTLPQNQGMYSGRAPEFIAATLAHGAAHGGIAHMLRQGPAGSGEDAAGQADEAGKKDTTTTITTTTVYHVFILGMFWVTMLYAILPKVKLLAIASLALAVSYFQSTLGEQYGFTYVQTVLMTCFSIHELTQTDKNNREYARYPLMVGLPTVICGWIESLHCTAFYQSIGGHVWYDGTIAVTQILFYIHCYLHGTISKSKMS
jgi:hypothetical protein